MSDRISRKSFERILRKTKKMAVEELEEKVKSLASNEEIDKSLDYYSKILSYEKKYLETKMKYKTKIIYVINETLVNYYIKE